MGDQSGVGTFVAYMFICLFLAVIVLVFLRLFVMLSLLWLMPLAAVLRRVPGVRRFIPVARETAGEEEGRV